MGGEEGRRGRAGQKEWEEKKDIRVGQKKEGKSKRKKRIWVQLGKKEMQFASCAKQSDL